MQNELRYIQTIHQNGSFSKAAEVLHLTQPALSIAIHRVESEIGMPLFDRTQKPLALTEAGYLYIEKIKQIQLLEDELKNQLSDLSSMSAGNVRIGATSYIISCILPPVLLRFRKQYPGVRLNIVEAGAYELKEMILEQKLDMTFVSQPCREAAFKRHEAFQDRLILAVPVSFAVNEVLRGFALSNGDIQAKRHIDAPPVDLNVFSDTPFILLEEKYDLRKRTDSFFAEADIRPNICMEVAQIITAYALSRAGIGATFLPDRAVSTGDQDMLFYKIASYQAVRNMGIVTNSKNYISCAVQRFIEMFVAYYHGSEQTDVYCGGQRQLMRSISPLTTGSITCGPR